MSRLAVDPPAACAFCMGPADRTQEFWAKPRMGPDGLIMSLRVCQACLDRSNRLSGATMLASLVGIGGVGYLAYLQTNAFLGLGLFLLAALIPFAFTKPMVAKSQPFLTTSAGFAFRNADYHREFAARNPSATKHLATLKQRDAKGRPIPGVVGRWLSGGFYMGLFGVFVGLAGNTEALFGGLLLAVVCAIALVFVQSRGADAGPAS